MNERSPESIPSDYKRIEEIANDLYKEAELLVGVQDQAGIFKEKMASCARLEEQAFYLSMDAGVGNLIRDTHVRYVIQNYFRAGLYNDVIRFGRRASGCLIETESERTMRQVQGYVEAATKIVLKGHPQPSF